MNSQFFKFNLNNDHIEIKHSISIEYFLMNEKLFTFILIGCFISILITPIIFEQRIMSPPVIMNEKILNPDRDYMSIVTIPFPLVVPGYFEKLHLSVSNWLMTSPSTKVVLLVNHSEFDLDRKFYNLIESEFGPGRLKYGPCYSTDRNNIPYVHDQVLKSVTGSDSNIITIINSDILLPGNWLKNINRVLDILGNSACITGYRVNFNLTWPTTWKIHYNTTEIFSDISKLISSGQPKDYGYRGMDFFTFRTDPTPIDLHLHPPMIIGRFDYDTWLMGAMNYWAESVSLGTEYRSAHIAHLDKNYSRTLPLPNCNKRIRWMYWKFDGDNLKTNWAVQNSTLIHRKNQIRIDFDDFIL